MTKKINWNLTTATIIGALTLSASAVFAQGPDTNNCWGTVVSQRAVTYRDIGEHASSQEEPRVGVGNLAKIFDMSVGELAQLLGTLDDGLGQDPLGAIHCP